MDDGAPVLDLLVSVDCCSCAMSLMMLFLSVSILDILESSSHAFPPWSCSDIASSNIQPSSSVAINPCASNLDKGFPDWPYGSHTFVGRFAVGSFRPLACDCVDMWRSSRGPNAGADETGSVALSCSIFGHGVDDGRWREVSVRLSVRATGGVGELSVRFSGRTTGGVGVVSVRLSGRTTGGVGEVSVRLSGRTTGGVVSTLTFGHIVDGRWREVSVRSSFLCIRCRPIMPA